MTFEDFRKEWYDGCEYVKARTSGSTGVPKSVLLPKSDMSVSALATNAFFGIDRGSVLAIPLPMDYIAGKMMAVRAFEAGCAIDVIAPSNDFTPPRRATLLSVVPSQVPRLLELGSDDIPVADNVLVGGAGMNPTIESRLAAMPWESYATYGMTETCSHVALRHINARTEVYTAMPGVSFSADSRGCLIIEAPEYTFKRLVTNDIVDLKDSRSFVWLGRYDNVINSSGVKFFPEELERKFADIVGTDFYVVGASHDKWGVCVAIVAEGEKSAAAPMAAALSCVFPHISVPKKIWMVPSLPRTANGKLKRIVPDTEPSWMA